MTKIFTNDFFAGNRARLRQSFTDTSLLVFTANGLLQRGADGTFPFQQDASFWYLTGIDEPGVVLVVDGEKEYVIVPELSDYQNIFDGSTDAATIAHQSGIHEVLPGKEGWKKLATRLKRAKKVGTLKPNPPFIETYGMFVNPARQHLITKMQEANSAIHIVDARSHVSKLRMIKQPVELQAIQHAVDLTADSLEAAQRKLPGAKYEYELEAEITGHIVRHGAVDAWKPIVAGGKNACVLHSHKNSSRLSKDELVVLDVGAEAEHYVADITRTWAIAGQPTERQQAVFDAVLAVQDYAFTLQKPGAYIRKNEQEVERFMGEKLRELGLVTEVKRENIRKYFPHATSHFLGLDPHDAGDYEQPLAPGVVLTVEPGIYIPEEGIGVRIEDDILITENGYKNLSERLPRSLG